MTWPKCWHCNGTGDHPTFEGEDCPTCAGYGEIMQIDEAELDQALKDYADDCRHDERRDEEMDR